MGDREGLIHAYDEEHELGLTDLAEDDSEEGEIGMAGGEWEGV